MIYDEALALVSATPDDTPKSDLWAEATQGLTAARATFSEAGPFIHWITGIDNFTMPHHGPDREVIVDRWLEVMPIFPVEESPHAAPGGIVLRDGVRMSTQHMLHSYYARQIDALEPMHILELGAGFGGLARILATGKPREYTILDIPSSLFCSYVYLRTHFPNGRHVWANTVADLFVPADFRYVPACLWRDLKLHKFDMAINTCSLGEMLPETVADYLSLIGETCTHFYSHNREGSVTLGRPQWEHLVDEVGGHGQIDPAMPPSHEQLVRRCAR